MAGLLIVTGGSSGIGAALLDHAGTSWRRVDVSRRGWPGADRHVAADLADVGTWPAVTAAIAEEVGAHPWERVVMVHAAGVLSPVGFAADVDLAAYTRSVLVNAASGQVLGTAFLAAASSRPGRRQLCLVSSGAATTPYPGWSAYSAGKAALEAWTRTVGAEQDQRGGVEVCAIAPGVVDTPMQDEVRAAAPHDFPQVGRFQELKSTGALRTPADVAADLWRVLDAGLASGAVADLRTLDR